MLVAMTLSEGTVLRKYLYAFESESCGDVEEGEICAHGKLKQIRLQYYKTHWFTRKEQMILHSRKRSVKVFYGNHVLIKEYVM